MKLRIDTSRSYALALEGGGAKGAYQIGAWKALREAGVKIDAVAGTSVGALNGSLIVMGDLEKAENIWENIRYSQVMDVDDETMSRLLKGDVKLDELDSVAQQMFEVIKNRGFDVTPLRKWISQVVDEKTVRESPVELFIDTFSLSDGKLLELRAKDLPEGTLCDMLLASAYLPVFRSEKLGGKRYADGGLRDVLPLHVLIAHGYKDILALRLFGIGVERSVKIPEDTRVYTVEPTADLGSTLEFEPAQSRENLRAGYYDMQRFLYGLRGTKYYVDCDWDETKALSLLSDAASAGESVSLRTLCEKQLPALAKRLDAEKGGVKETEYAYALIFCDDFDSYVSSREKDFGGKEKTYEFFFDKYLLSLSVTGVTEYGVNNPIRRILDEKGDVITDNNLKLMQAFLTGLKEKEENAENDVLAEDSERINSLLGE